MIKKIIHFIQVFRLRLAIRKANNMFADTGMKFFVIKYKRRFLVKSRKEMERLIAEKYFKKGVTIQFIKKIALYETR